MKVATILGTRPEIIRLSRIVPRLDACCDHVLVHTGQNFEPGLSKVFFEELDVRRPDHELTCRGETAIEQIARILVETERVIAAERPDRVLILGDTNSALSALAAKKLGVPVFHMEAGNRCFDDRVPEEVNRRIVDHASDVLLPYTRGSAANLEREGIPPARIRVTGNPIREVLDHHAAEIEASDVLARHGLEPGRYLLATLHRAETVDVPERLGGVLEAFDRLGRVRGLPIVWSVHPRTRAALDAAGVAAPPGMLMLPPLGLFDFVKLERNALCVLTDSGTVQEECCLYRIPSVILRDVTERPETIEVGSGMLAGTDPESIVPAVARVLARPPDWTPPPEYMALDVGTIVADLITSPPAA